MVRVKQKTVFVAMSGGVDSSVAAALLKKRGFDVVGVFMRNWRTDDLISCTAEEDQRSARMAAAAIGIPLYTWDFSKEYKERVVDYMVTGYRQGITPNPDVMCNKEIKFGLFLEKALKLGADFIATGHYVRLATSHLGIGDRDCPKSLNPSGHTLLAARDTNKDQSYFLWTLTQEQLKYCLFPIGEYTKPQVREMAGEFGLPNAERKDSQGLCFVGKVDFPQFLANYIPPRPGAVVTTAGWRIGEHQGVQFYTIGQRHGIGIGGGMPYFVAQKDAERNVLVLAEGIEDPALWQKELAAENINWISGKEPRFPLRCLARIRYRQPLQRAMISKIQDTRYKIQVIFDDLQRAVAPGQSVVFYASTNPSAGNGKEMLGGGVILANRA